MAVCAKPFHLIPGPKSFPIVGTLPHYFLTRQYDMDQLHINGRKKLEQFGKIVKEDIVPGTSIVWLFDPDDIKKMFEVEGEYPSRRSHLALEHYRLSKPEIYGNAGLLPTNGPEWAKIRSSFQFRPKVVEDLLPQFNSIAQETMEVIEEKTNFSPNGEIEMLQEIKKFFLEITAMFLFGVRIGSIQMNLERSSMSQRLMDAALQTNENILNTDNGLQLWKHFKTKPYNAIRNGQETIEEVSRELIKKHDIKFPFKQDSKISEKDIFTFVSDMLLAGIDTSSYTTGFLLYHLARNPEKQTILRHAIRERDSRYGKLVLKESLRLNPISVGVSRFTAEEAIFSGFSIPPGSLMVSQNQVSCRLSRYFESPDSFIPERWQARNHYHPFLTLPFGHGKRMCIGRRLAEQSILVLVHHFVSNFEISWPPHRGSLDCVSKLINKPNKDLITRLQQVSKNF